MIISSSEFLNYVSFEWLLIFREGRLADHLFLPSGNCNVESNHTVMLWKKERVQQLKHNKLGESLF